MLMIAVCDDEQKYSDSIRRRVEAYMQQRAIAAAVEVYNTPLPLVAAAGKYDLVLLDVQMGGLDGMQAAMQIREAHPDVFIIFISNYIQYAPQGYRVSAIRYLLKSSLEQELEECLTYVLAQWQRQRELFSLPLGKGENVAVPLQKICYFESQKRKILLHMRQHLPSPASSFYGKLAPLAEQLGSKGFLYCHQSFLVNAACVSRLQAACFIMENGDLVPISRSRYRSVRQAYFSWLANQGVD